MGRLIQVPVAQLDRALVCGTKGWRFDPSRVHQKESTRRDAPNW